MAAPAPTPPASPTPAPAAGPALPLAGVLHASSSLDSPLARRSSRPDLLIIRRASQQATPRSASGLKLIICQDYAEVSERVATLLASRIIENPAYNLAVSVGATPTRAYSCLTQLDARNVASLDDCHFYLLDEFYGPAPLPAGPHLTELHKGFFHQAQIPAEHVHAPDATLSPAQAAAAYAELANLRRLDGAVLGIGPHGNVGWLGAATDREAGVHVVPLGGEQAAGFGQGYAQCVTMGLKQLMACREIFLLAVNRNKAETVEKVLADTQGATAAGWLIHHHPRVFVLLDAAAAQKLIAQNKSPALNVPGFSFLTEEAAGAIAGKNIVCFAPHPDDTSISAGATLAMLSGSNNVTSCVATTGHRAYIPNTSTAEERIAIREREASDEARLLGARVRFLRLPLYNHSSVVAEEDVRMVQEYLEEAKPHIIFMPQTGDSHQTHRAVAKAILLALQRYHSKQHAAGLPPTAPIDLYLYEGPWSLYSKGSYNVIASPGAEHFARKIAAIQDRLELFYKRTILSPEDIQQLLIWLEGSLPPKKP